MSKPSDPSKMPKKGKAVSSKIGSSTNSIPRIVLIMLNCYRRAVRVASFRRMKIWASLMNNIYLTLNQGSYIALVSTQPTIRSGCWTHP
jgi:hypothetical protein